MADPRRPHHGRRPAAGHPPAGRRRPGPAGGVRRAQGGPGRRRLHQPGAARGAPPAPADRPRRRLRHRAGRPGTLRRRGTYDAVLAACVDRPLAKVEAKVLDALRLGRPPAAVDAGARATPRSAPPSTWSGPGSGRGRPGSATPCCAGSPSTTSPGGYAGSHPTRPRDPVGFAVDRAQPSALGRRGAVPGRRRGRARRPARRRQRAPAGGAGRAARAGRRRDELPGPPTLLSPYGVVLEGGDPGAVPAVAEGRAGVQDEGSQLVALALARAPVEGAGRALAGPLRRPGRQGGPAGRAGGRAGRRLLAAERQPHRARLVQRALAGAEGVAGVVTADGTRPAVAGRRRSTGCWSTRPAPGLGALRRRPEARWRRSPDDLRELVPLQRALLDAALDSVRPGGVVLYATCSPGARRDRRRW